MDREARKEQILKELEAESDRGCILVAASALDVFLEELLRTALVADAHAAKHSVTPLFEAMGPMATFSAKIKLAYGLGLITKTDFTDLEKIRRIRNIASHEYSAMTFDSREIIEISRTLDSADLVVQHLPVPDKKATTNPPVGTPKPQATVSMERVRFIFSAVWVAARLETTSKSFESARRLAASRAPRSSHPARIAQK
jgi:DNA-binding MltR family transcriptional regulator